MSNCTCDYNVEYCCVKNVPTFFNNKFNNSSGNRRLFYDPTCLSCVIKPINAEIICSSGYDQSPCMATLYAATIVGCMPYQAEWRFDSPATCNKPTSGTSNASISCVSNACFNNVVKIGCLKDLIYIVKCINELLNNPDKACSLITNPTRICELFSCEDPIQTLPSSEDGKCTNRFVRFSGEFVIDYNYLATQCPSE